MRSLCSLLFVLVASLTLSVGSADAAYVAPTLSPRTPDQAFGKAGAAAIDPGKGMNFFDESAVTTGAEGGYLIAGVESKSGDPDIPDGHFAVVSVDVQGRVERKFGTKAAARIPRNTLMGRRIDASTPISVSMQSDGTFLVVSMIKIGSRQAGAVMRFTIDGKLDSSFGQGGIVIIRSIAPRPLKSGDAWLMDAAVDRAGRPLVYGWSEQLRRDGKMSQVIYRLHKDGSVDRGFGRSGRVVARTRVDLLASWMSGRVFAGGDGTVYTVAGEAPKSRGGDWVLRAFEPDGRVSRSFGKRGVAKVSWSRGEPSLDSVDFLPGAGFVLGGSAAGKGGDQVGLLERFSMSGKHTGSLTDVPLRSVIATFLRSGSVRVLGTTGLDAKYKPQNLICDGDLLLVGSAQCGEVTLPSGIRELPSEHFIADRGSSDKLVGSDEKIVVVDSLPGSTPSGRGVGVWRYVLP